MDDKPKSRPEPLDYLLAAIAPVFVIGMIGSLVYFVLIVLYRGNFPTRLMWILGLFTIAAVLIARIAIEQSRTYSIGYMVGLGAAVFIAAPAYLAGQGGSMIGGLLVLFVMVIVVAYLADRITFDCTSMNERSSSTGIGLLQSLGLFRADGYDKARSVGNPTASDTTKRRKHNPGVWVLYFSLLALPLFAIGQWFVDGDTNRAFCFRMLFVYLFCSFCLLTMIALLTLRKYLRERDIEMDASFAVRWLMMGIIAAFVLLLCFAVMPIPSKSLVKWDLPFQLKERDDLKAHRLGWGNEGANDNNPDAPQAQKGQQADQANSDQGDKAKQPDPSGESGKRPGDGSGDNDSSDKSSNDDKAQSKNDRQPSDSSQSSQKNKDDNSKNEQGSKDAKRSEGTLKESPDKAKRDNRNQGDKKEPNNDEPPNDNKNREPKEDAERKPNPNDNKDAKRNEAPPNKAPQQNWSLQWNPGSTFQWIVVIILVIVALVYGFLHRDKLLQLLGLLLRKRASNKSVKSIEQIDNEAEVQDLCPPFSSFFDPFAKSGLSREQIVNHIFQALQSWGYERRVIRSDEETPDEYVRRLAKKFPEQLENFRILGFLYSRIAYARGKVTNQEISPLLDLWKWLQAS